ncbi:hypothetical protein DEO72_LG9g1261 [Vigna unguiculata]|uniref:Uncharacterized protein n=2 Tax=Vigna unguiculata TaxID=3917 RepID=A0A4D6MXL7_VIGUN|nr:hypothetical protein DEO72_LG9g1261 [Vigna unguiculata]
MQTGTSFVKYGRKTWSKPPQGFIGGRILGRVSGVVRAAGMTLVEYTAAGPGDSEEAATRFARGRRGLWHAVGVSVWCRVPRLGHQPPSLEEILTKRLTGHGWLGLRCGEAAMYVPVWVIFRGEWEFVGMSSSSHGSNSGESDASYGELRDQLAASAKGEGSSKAAALAGPGVETVRPAATRPAVSKLKGVGKDRKRLRALAKTGGVAPGGINNPDLGGFEKAKVQMRKGVEIKLTDPEVALVEAADPGLIMRAWNEYMSRGLVELDQRTWDEEKKKLEAEVKKLKVGVLAAEKKLKLKQVEVDELQARRKAESEEAADEISGLQQAVYTEHVKGFEKALRQAKFLYKEVSVTDCRFNVNLDIYDNKMLDVAEISKLKAAAEGEEVARDEEGTLMTTPLHVGDDRASNEEGVGEEAEAEVADDGDDGVREE